MFRELTPPEAYGELAGDDSAVPVDCRAPAEWCFTGIADLSGIGKKPVLAAIADEAGRPNPDFAEEIKAVANLSTPVYVICRVGGRSATACHMLAEAGFTDLINVTEGFEGRADENGRRTSVEGWRFHDLPWVQSRETGSRKRPDSAIARFRVFSIFTEIKWVIIGAAKACTYSVADRRCDGVR